VLSAGEVNPASGDTTTTFTYSVSYTDADNDATSSINVIIDGTPHAMSVRAGEDGDYTNGEVYEYSTTGALLGVGSHTFQFEASDGIDDATGDTGIHSGPTVAPGLEPELCPDEYRWGSYNWDPFPVTFVGRQEVHFVNNGEGDAFNVVAAVTWTPINVVATGPDVTLGDIPAGNDAWSSDTFELRVDMTNPQDPSEGIVWRVEYDDAAGVHHVVENVPIFCGQAI
jgi:endoglucanase